jgi:predicted phage gp36 major capsid-like protein
MKTFIGIVIGIIVAVVLSVAATMYIRQDDMVRIRQIEKEVKDFRKETQDNFDSLKAEVLRNRAEIEKCQGKLDTVIAGETVIFNEIRNLDKDRAETGTSHDFLEAIKTFLGF